MAWVNFCRAKSFIGISTDFSIVIDCKSVEIPPKLITKLDRTKASLIFERVERERQPFVISTIPCKKQERVSGRRFKIGDRHSITIKKMAIIAPTEIMAMADVVTISLISNFDFVVPFVSILLSSILSIFLNFIFLYNKPFKKAPTICEIKRM